MDPQRFLSRIAAQSATPADYRALTRPQRVAMLRWAATPGLIEPICAHRMAAEILKIEHPEAWESYLRGMMAESGAAAELVLRVLHKGDPGGTLEEEVRVEHWRRCETNEDRYEEMQDYYTEEELLDDIRNELRGALRGGWLRLDDDARLQPGRLSHLQVRVLTDPVDPRWCPGALTGELSPPVDDRAARVSAEGWVALRSLLYSPDEDRARQGLALARELAPNDRLAFARSALEAGWGWRARLPMLCCAPDDGAAEVGLRIWTLALMRRALAFAPSEALSALTDRAAILVGSPAGEAAYREASRELSGALRELTVYDAESGMSVLLRDLIASARSAPIARAGASAEATADLIERVVQSGVNLLCRGSALSLVERAARALEVLLWDSDPGWVRRAYLEQCRALLGEARSRSL